jgi:hypothetical protein
MKEMKIIRAVLLCVSTMFLLVTTGCSRDNDVMSESSYQFMEKVKEISDIESPNIHNTGFNIVVFSDVYFVE